MRVIGFCFALLFSTGAAAQDEAYLCIADMATGCKFDKTTEKWESVNFNVSDHKYIIARYKLAGYAWTVTKVGDAAPTGFCVDDMHELDQTLSCDTSEPSFHFSKKTLKFVSVSKLPYIFGFTVLLSRPYIAIGKCSPL